MSGIDHKALSKSMIRLPSIAPSILSLLLIYGIRSESQSFTVKVAVPVLRILAPSISGMYSTGKECPMYLMLHNFQASVNSLLA